MLPVHTYIVLLYFAIRVLHVCAEFMAAATGIMCTWYFSTILYGFNKHCPLFATMEFSLIRPNSIGHNFLPKNVTINIRESNWGPVLKCQYCLSIWMISFISGVSLGTFFIYNQKGGRGQEYDTFVQPWRHIYPALLVSLIMMIQAAFAAYFSAHGFDVFCLEFQPYVDDAKCNHLIDKFTLPIRNRVIPIYTAMIIVKTCAPLCIFAWLFLTLTLIMRIILTPDFKVQMIKIVGIRKIAGEKSLTKSLMGSLQKQVPLNNMPEFSLMNLDARKSPKRTSKQSKKDTKKDTKKDIPSNDDILSRVSDISDISMRVERKPSSKRRRSINLDRSSSDRSIRSDLEVPIHRRRNKQKKGRNSLEEDDEPSPSTSRKDSIDPHEIDITTPPPPIPPKQSWLSRWWNGPAQPKDVEAQPGHDNNIASSAEHKMDTTASNSTKSKSSEKEFKKKPSIAFKDEEDNVLERTKSEEEERKLRKNKKNEKNKNKEENE